MPLEHKNMSPHATGYVRTGRLLPSMRCIPPSSHCTALQNPAGSGGRTPNESTRDLLGTIDKIPPPGCALPTMSEAEAPRVGQLPC